MSVSGASKDGHLSARMARKKSHLSVSVARKEGHLSGKFSQEEEPLECLYGRKEGHLSGSQAGREGQVARAAPGARGGQVTRQGEPSTLTFTPRKCRADA